MTFNNTKIHKEFLMELELEKEIWLMEFIESKDIERAFQEIKSYLLERHQRKLEITQKSYHESMEEIKKLYENSFQENATIHFKELEQEILLKKISDGRDEKSENERMEQKISALQETKEKAIPIKRKMYIKNILIKTIFLLVLLLVSYLYIKDIFNFKVYIAIMLGVFVFYEIQKAISIREKIHRKHQLNKKQSELIDKKFEELLRL